MTTGEIVLDEVWIERGDAYQVNALRWHAHPECERLVVDIGAVGGVPATHVGEMKVEVHRELGIVRLSLRDVSAVAEGAIGAVFHGDLLHSVYAIRSDVGPWIDIDLHLAAAAEVRVLRLASPARLVVDLRPGGEPLKWRPVTSRHIVLVEPRAGQRTYPLHVNGYGRTFESNIVLRLLQEGEVVHETFTTATAWLEAWGAYGFVIPEGPEGHTVLQVGEYSAKDGAWEGVEVELYLESQW